MGKISRFSVTQNLPFQESIAGSPRISTGSPGDLLVLKTKDLPNCLSLTVGLHGFRNIQTE